VTQTLARATCPACGRDVALRNEGQLREHSTDGSEPTRETKCQASGYTPEGWEGAQEPKDESSVEAATVAEALENVTELGKAIRSAADEAPVMGVEIAQLPDKVESIERVSIDKIVPSKNNRPAKNLEALTESIRTVGILQPPVVKSNGSGDIYELVMGHRRHAAAKLAGLTEIDVIVRTQDEVEAMRDNIVENLHRDDLDPLEEAAGYALLIHEHGMTQEQVAKAIGVSQPHISKRVTLLLLPASVAAAVNAEDPEERLPLEGAQALLKLKDQATMEKIWKRAKGMRWPSSLLERIQSEVDRHLRDDEARRKVAAAKKKAKDAGLKLMPNGEYPSTYGSKPSAFIGKGEGKLVFPTPKAHESEACHRVLVTDAGAARAVCVEPDRHKPKGASKLKGSIDTVSQSSPRKSAAQSEAEKQRKELEAKFDELLESREEFVISALKRVTKDDALELTTQMLLEDRYGDWFALDEETAVKLLTGPSPRRSRRKANADILKKLVEASPQNQARLCAATVIIGSEQAMHPVFSWSGRRGSWAPFAFYFDWLKRKGYQISELEQEQLDIKEGGR
jgi:ParB/RepB/Spo0J family partition protein